MPKFDKRKKQLEARLAELDERLTDIEDHLDETPDPDWEENAVEHGGEQFAGTGPVEGAGALGAASDFLDEWGKAHETVSWLWGRQGCADADFRIGRATASAYFIGASRYNPCMRNGQGNCR